MITALSQTPAAGSCLLRYLGDVVEFRVESPTPIRGRAFLRTNLGGVHYQRKEIIEHVEQEITPGFQDWRNLPMNRINEFTFNLKLLLTEVGHFEGKCCIADLNACNEPEWVEGDNTSINVEPAPYCCSNSVYCAFTRQFGINKNKPFSTLPDGVTAEELNRLDQDAYSVIPSSGTFRSLIRELDHIFDTLHCRILHLLPIHPGPTVYGRMGRFGSPYAALDFTGINPELAEFDRKATPLEQFQELVDAVHRKAGRIFIDIAINHTGWAAKLHETHPEWFVREKDGTIHSPGAWGVTWGDLTELDHSKPELWKYLAEVFRLWCIRGVDGFRCDAGYMIPEPAWKYIIARVRDEFPDTIFLLEGLGGDPAVTTNLLNHANMNWAYSELFQNYSRFQVEGYLKYAWLQSAGVGLLIHYAETHDNLRLAATSHEYARMRTALAALTSTNGAFGFTNGVEWFAKEKIDVHEASALNWGAKENQVRFISRLNIILTELSCFHNGAQTSFIDSHTDNCTLIGRMDAGGNCPVLIAVNLDIARGATASWNVYSAPFHSYKVYDLLSGKQVELMRLPGGNCSLQMPGGSVFCFTPDKALLDRIESRLKETAPDYIHHQVRMQEACTVAAMAIARKNNSILSEYDSMRPLAEELLESPETFLHKLYGEQNPAPYVIWRCPEDLRRTVMVPPGYYLLIQSDSPVRAILDRNGHLYACNLCLRRKNGKFFLLILPQEVPEKVETIRMQLNLLSDKKIERRSCELLYLPQDVVSLQTGLERKDFHRAKFHFMRGNGRGGLLWHTIEPGELRSRYDALLLANLNPDFPENRHIMLRRFRIWSHYYAKEQAFNRDCMKNFYLDEQGAGVWNFELPVGNGLFTDVSMKVELIQQFNAVRLTIQRHSGTGRDRRLEDDSPIHFLVRPDLEDRSFHNSTKASMGPERIWPGKVQCGPRNFFFRPAPDRILTVTSGRGHFRRADEWQYMVWQEEEAVRGLDPYTDLYSPGYFEFGLAGDETVVVVAQVMISENEQRIIPEPVAAEPMRFLRETPIRRALKDSLAQFIVKRDSFKTIIAGYPWFLDWGRDTLIAVRGLIASGDFMQDAEKILLQFANFAERGTIPNMICGNNADNRDTSDAPLWLFTACRDLCEKQGSRDFLQSVLPNGKTLLNTLVELAEGIEQGTPNGIRADKESQLVFSPKHFTWMDTNYPAGTPREGYPVEIQALWFAALHFLGEVLPAPAAEIWQKRAETVAASLRKYFWLPDKKYLADCLQCQAGMTPGQGEPADHLRPNQLYAVTLGAITDPVMMRGILNACSFLLVPGGIRSLDDASVHCPLPVFGMDSRLLNDPLHPYWGQYEGDEDTRRKPAYHNGTVWTWQFPAYCEAFYRVYGESGRKTAVSLLSSITIPMNAGCLCQITEIMDGDSPHTQRGCGAQAWSISEFLRVHTLLHADPSQKA